MWKNTATDKWVQTGGVAPKPLLEFTFAVQADGKLLTYYDLSAVDGYVVRLQQLHNRCGVQQGSACGSRGVAPARTAMWCVLRLLLGRAVACRAAVCSGGRRMQRQGPTGSSLHGLHPSC